MDNVIQTKSSVPSHIETINVINKTHRYITVGWDMPDANGEVVIDYLLENCDPEFVNFQMDLYWVTKAGADPLAYFEKYPGRFKLWHVKDMDKEGRFAPVGNGTIDFETILAKKELSGMQSYFVEQDRTYTMEPLEAIKVSHEGLKKIGFN